MKSAFWLGVVLGLALGSPQRGKGGYPRYDMAAEAPDVSGPDAHEEWMRTAGENLPFDLSTRQMALPGVLQYIPGVNIPRFVNVPWITYNPNRLADLQFFDEDFSLSSFQQTDAANPDQQSTCPRCPRCPRRMGSCPCSCMPPARAGTRQGANP